MSEFRQDSHRRLERLYEVWVARCLTDIAPSKLLLLTLYNITDLPVH